LQNEVFLMKQAIKFEQAVNMVLAADTPYVIKVLKMLEKHIKESENFIMDWIVDNNYDYYEGLDVLKDSLIKQQIADFEKDGWKIGDAFSFLKLTEEIDPTIPEDIALRRMQKIQDKYRR